MSELLTLLAELDRVGLRLAPGIAASMISTDFDPNDGHEMLLCYLGGESEDDASVLLSHDILHVDTECIAGDGDYAAVAVRMALLAGDDLPLTNIRDQVSEDGVWLTFDLDGEPVSWPLRLDGDWVDPEVFSHFADLLKARGLGRYFTYHDLGGQDFLVGCASAEQLDEINRVPGLHFVWLE